MEQGYKINIVEFNQCYSLYFHGDKRTRKLQGASLGGIIRLH